MFEKDIITHTIERHILGVLLRTEYARFRDLRPNNVDTNLFSYHLKQLVRTGFVVKTDDGYTLSSKGASYVDRISEKQMRIRTQPKIITMLLVQDSLGRVLLQHRTKQPYINTWTLPNGKLHIDDGSVLDAARRESSEKLNFIPDALRHCGDCYITVRPHESDAIETRTLAHIVRFETDAIKEQEDLRWVKPLHLADLRLAPAVEQIVARAFFGDSFFFEEFDIDIR